MARPRLVLLLALLVPGVVSCKGDEPSARPVVDITFPEPGSLQTDARIRVRGSAANTAQVEVDGFVAEVVGGEWEVLVPVDQGEVTVTATSGDARDMVTFTVDSVPPQIVVTTPERALYRSTAEGDTVTVAGSVSDEGTGLEIIAVGEQIVRPDAGGNWSWDVPLREGLNEIVVTARDVAGNESDDVRGVMYGDFVPPAMAIEPGFDIWLNETAMGVMEEVMEGFITPENMMVMAAAFESEFVKVSSIQHDPVEVTLVMRPGVITANLVIRNLVLQGAFTLSGTEHDIRVAASLVVFTVGITPYATPDGRLDVAFSDPVLQLSPDNLSYDIGDLSDEDNQYLEDLVIGSARAGLEYVLGLGFFAAIYDDEVLNRKIALLGKEIIFQVAFENVEVFSEGLLVQTSITMPVAKWPEVRDSPGALNREPGPSSGYEPTGHIAFSVVKSTFDRLLHGVWHSGLLHYQLDSAAFAGFELPVELTAGALATAIDARISSVAGGSVPAALRMRPMFPPVAEFDVENRRLLIELGEFHVDLLLLPPGQQPIVLATISAFLDLSVRLSITEGIVVRLEFDTELRADVAAEPEVDLDDERAETFLEDLIALIPEVLASGLDLRGEADVTWVTLSSPSVWVHGVQDDYGTINLTMTANPQTLDPFEPPMMP